MASALLHPTLMHPRTGIRLEAIGVVNGKVVWPMLGASEPPAPPAPPAPPTPPTPPAPPAPPEDKGFPEGTPLEQMKPEQREAYWKHYARQHEERAKLFKGLTPEKLAELQDKASKHDALELELGTTADKAAAKAREEAEAAARATMQPSLIEARLDAAAARAGVPEEDLKKAIEFVDTTKFLAAAGSVDTDKVKAFIATITPAKGNSTTPPKGPTVTGHGAGGGSGTSPLSGLSGSELYDRLHPKKTA